MKKIYWNEKQELQLESNDLGMPVDINDQEIAFYGNPDLLPSGTKLNYTIEMIEEIVNCRDDIIYFAENYYKAQTPNGFSHIVLHDYQKEILQEMVHNQHYVLMMPRQMGKCIEKDTKLFLNNTENNTKYEQTIEELFEDCKNEAINNKNGITH